MKFFKKQESSPQDADLDKLRHKVDEAGMPPAVNEVALSELERLSKISTTTAEYTIGLTYIDYLATMPWIKRTIDNLDIRNAERILEEDHYGLEEIKERILEYLAVRTLRLEKRFQILVVEDDEIARKNMVHILTKEGYDPQTAENGVEALRFLESREYDLVLTDLRMEKCDGMEVLTRTKEKWPDIDVIMITAYATVSSATEAMKRGAFDYICKPFQLDEVRATIRRALEKRVIIQETRGPILCFVGPPGIGKTSLGLSIARALGRKFVRISLAGMKDEAEIRGHRRTYVGAMPGRIIQEICRAGSNNPLFMLDEVDKIGQDFKGDAASALLEALDSEQNRQFIDHYLDMPFDLSKVIFIVTANIVDPIPSPLLDRMEVLPLSSYTDEEKKKIALRYLIPRQIVENALEKHPVEFTEESVNKIIHDYTREAGLRNLERQIASICRKIARKVLYHRGEWAGLIVTPDLVENYLGPKKFHYEVAEAKDRVGVTTGLVWTPTGGDTIFIEVTMMKGKGRLILTGSLGDVMQESAQASLSYIRSHAEALGIQENLFSSHDIHIHVPAGAIPKDGPSAGVTIAMALLSLLRNRPARREVAMSGELTLTGRILPVAGIKEKVLAANRAGVRLICFPKRNQADIEAQPDNILKDMKIALIETIEEIIDLVLVPSH